MNNVLPLARPRAKAAPEILQLRIELLYFKPAIWRRLWVPATITLPKLHQVFQATMGWENYHLHEFEITGERYGIPDPEFDRDSDLRSQARVRLGKILGDAKSFQYTYDFGDNWQHRVKVEKWLPPDPDITYCAMCIDGANACPPEDVGSTSGYEDYLDALTNPRHPEHADMLSWRGPFDPAHFDLAQVNLELMKIRI